MVAYSFKQRFVPKILSGAKCHTIRSDRKRHARDGEALQLYTGMRTKHCHLIGVAICARVVPVQINLNTGRIQIGVEAFTEPADLDAFARSDGFNNWIEMQFFWIDNHPNVAIFSGVLIGWRDLAE
jgi:hypothetical protein